MCPYYQETRPQDVIAEWGDPKHNCGTCRHWDGESCGEKEKVKELMSSD